MNRVLLVGRLVRDAEVKLIGEDSRGVMNFILAVSRNYESENGEREADFIPVCSWNKGAHSLSKYLTKGRLISVAGKINVRSFDGQDGKKRYVTQVVADEIQFLDFKKKEEA